MAIDPNILLRGIVPNLGETTRQALDIGQSIRQAPARNRLLEAQTQQQELTSGQGADFYNQRIQQLHPDGGFVRQWGTTGKSGVSAGAFNYPTDVAIGPDGTIFVADGYNDRVQAFTADGRFSHKWGGPFAMNIYGPFNGWFATVTSLAVDGEGNVFVADFYNHRVQKFAADGTFLTAFGGEGDGPGRFRYAIAVAVAEDGSVFVADFGNNRVQKFRQGG